MGPIKLTKTDQAHLTVADPGFSVGGRRPVERRNPPTRAFFSGNVCENERIGSQWERSPWIGQCFNFPLFFISTKGKINYTGVLKKLIIVKKSNNCIPVLNASEAV